ncbi:hypothetical protein T4B_2256 [Trichinella pseudospiralis]|uniref:Uncharacterized protein n=1 Tax=Trichinella pseudospiralis TaxID=6337 RepID=A0A0V1JJJ1_TRIPS|nr:hypothetical protein T4B_2256 [Trichinella pseudospiralis]KRZ35153.1 hypothetical protein T4C_11268 [Trichinella pseudospiralis]
MNETIAFFMGSSMKLNTSAISDMITNSESEEYYRTPKLCWLSRVDNGRSNCSPANLYVSATNLATSYRPILCAINSPLRHRLQ